ncbi:homoserine kinase [Chloroflexota bacterium]
MATYTKLLDTDIQKIAKKYQLNVVKYEPIEQGAGNTNYFLVTDQGKYILTIFEVDDSQVINMTRVLIMLEELKFPALPLHKNSTGDILTKYKRKFVMVRPFISGSVVKDLDFGMIKQVGNSLARLHEISPPDYLPVIHPYEKYLLIEILEQKIDNDYKRWVKDKYRSIEVNTPPNLPVGLAHGDLFLDNMLFENGILKAIIDFEDLCQIARILDLGMTAVGICINGVDLDIRKIKALVKGYQEVITMEAAEKEFLQMSIEWGAMMTSIWRFWNYNINMPDEAKSKHYMKMVEIAENTHLIQADTFMSLIFPPG